MSRRLFIPLILVVLGAVAFVGVQFGPTAAAALGFADPLTDASLAAAAPTTVGGQGTPAAATSTRATSGRQNVAVRRGSIAQMLPLEGRVAALEEIQVVIPSAGRVDGVPVHAGDQVESGQVLLTLDSKQVETDLTTAKARVETDRIRRDQMQTQVVTQQQDATQRANAERVRQASAVADAQAGVARAQADYEKVKAGPSAAERQGLQNAVDQAAQGVARAEADLSRLSAGPDPNAVNIARAAAINAQSALTKAEQDLERLTSGPNPDAVRAAQREVDRAQNALKTAQATRVDDNRAARDQAVADAQLKVQDAQDLLAKARQGADQNAARIAQRDVERAQNALSAAQAVKVDDNHAARDAAIADAQLKVQDADDQLRRVQRGVDPAEVDAQGRAVQVAQLAFDAANERLDAATSGADQATLSTAQAAVTRAHAEFDAAQARLAEFNAHPSAAELADAQSRVTAARAALARAQGDGTPPSTVDGFDVTFLDKLLEQDQAQVDSLQGQLDTAKIRAPFAGTVTSVLLRPGDQVEAQRPAVVLAKPGDPIVRVALSDGDAAKVAKEQTADVRLGGPGAPVLSGSVVNVLSVAGGTARIGQVKVNWGAAPPPPGAAVQVSVLIQQKQDVLLVPKVALHSTGGRNYVEYMQGGSRRVQTVQVGIVSATDVEIVSGLAEGQQIVARQVTASASGNG